MIYADELDDREVGRADMAALLDEDPADWPAAAWCPAHGWHMPTPGTIDCPYCAARAVAHRVAMAACDRDVYDATIDHQHAHPEGP